MSKSLFLLFYIIVLCLPGCSFNASIFATPEDSNAVVSQKISFDMTTLEIAEGSAAVVNIIQSEKQSSETVISLTVLGDVSSAQTIPASVTIPAGSLSTPLNIQTLDDLVFLGSRRIQITLIPVDTSMKAEPNTLTLSIADNDLPTINFVGTSQTVSENVTTVTVTAQLNGIAPKAVTVPLVLSGTAATPSDYTIFPSSISILPEQTQAVFTITIVDDATVESTETIVLTMGTPLNAVLGANTINTTTITDNDLGSFTISGVTGPGGTPADNSQDAFLVGGLLPTMNWSASTAATSYDVTIYANDGTTVVCATQNTVSTSYNFSACTLTLASTYKASVTAKATGLSSVAANNLYSFYVNRPPIASNDGPIRIMKNSAGVTLQVVTASDSATRGTAADSDPDAGDTFTITGITQGSSAGVVTNSTTTVTYTVPSATFTGVETFTYTLTDNHGATAVGTVTIHVMDTYTWTGKSSANWNSNLNWCGTITNNSCNGSTGFPSSNATATHLAIFDGTCSATGHSCTANINTAVQAYGIKLDSSYTGTLTQAAAQTISIGASGFNQSGGTFAGGNSTFFTRTLMFNGGTFTSTSSTLTISVNNCNSTVFSIGNATVFNHNNGKVLFDRTISGCGITNTTLTVNQIFSVYDLQFAATSTGGGNPGPYIMSGTGKFVVNNDFTYASPSGDTLFYVDGGTIEVKGNIYSGSGSYAGSATIIANGTGNQTYSDTGSGFFAKLVINKPSGTMTPLSTTFRTNTLTLTQGSFTAPSTSLRVSILCYEANMFTLAAGFTFNHNSGKLIFNRESSGCGVSLGGIILNQDLSAYDVQFSSTSTAGGNNASFSQSGAGKIIVNNDITLTRLTGTGYFSVDNGTIDVKGNVYSGPGSYGGTTSLVLNGSGNQTYSDSSGFIPRLVINKSSGTVTPLTTTLTASAITFTQGSFTAPTGTTKIATTCYNATTLSVANGFTFLHNNGKILLDRIYGACGVAFMGVVLNQDFYAYDLQISTNTTGGNSGSVTLSGSSAKIYVENDLQLANAGGDRVFSLDGGHVFVQNNLSYGAGVNGGTTPLTLYGNLAQSISHVAGTAPSGNMTINKTGGSVTLQTNLTLNGTSQTLNVLTAAFNMNGKNATLKALSLNGNTITKNSGVLTVNGSAIGNGTFFGGTVDP